MYQKYKNDMIVSVIQWSLVYHQKILPIGVRKKLKYVTLFKFF